MPRVKICGITSLEDALLCVKSGADALGFIFADSPRRVDPDNARSIIENLPPWIAAVGVFADAPGETIGELKAHCRFTWVQLHGSEPPDLARLFYPHVIKTVFDPAALEGDYPCAAYLLDRPKSDSGPSFLSGLSGIRSPKPIILAGGLTVENIEDALARGDWYGVDVTRGVEARPGKKDPKKVAQFIEKVKGSRR